MEITKILQADGDPDQQKDLRKSAVASPRSTPNSFFNIPLFFPRSTRKDYFKQLGHPQISKARMEEEGKGEERKTAASF